MIRVDRNASTAPPSSSSSSTSSSSSSSSSATSFAKDWMGYLPEYGLADAVDLHTKTIAALRNKSKWSIVAVPYNITGPPIDIATIKIEEKGMKKGKNGKRLHPPLATAWADGENFARIFLFLFFLFLIFLAIGLNLASWKDCFIPRICFVSTDILFLSPRSGSGGVPVLGGLCKSVITYTAYCHYHCHCYRPCLWLWLSRQQSFHGIEVQDPHIFSESSRGCSRRGILQAHETISLPTLTASI